MTQYAYSIGTSEHASADENTPRVWMDPRHPGKHIDPDAGGWPISEWGYSCGRGFVSDARFGGGQVIKRTNRDTTRKWRRSAASSTTGGDK